MHDVPTSQIPSGQPGGHNGPGGPSGPGAIIYKKFNKTGKLQVDTEDQADQEAPEDQRRIIQLEHQADQKDLAVLEDLVALAAQADQAAQVVSEKSFANAN
jgi:hypothetical protein